MQTPKEIDIWYVLDRIGDLVPSLAQTSEASKAQRLFAPLAANLADVLSTNATRQQISDGVRRASAVLDGLRATYEIDEVSPAYLAGRLATVLDTLGLLARSRADDRIVELAKAEIKTLQALHAGPLSNKGLAEARDIVEEVACRSLRACRSLDLVETERKGRTNLNRLTRLAQSLFDDGFLLLPEKSGYDMRRVLRVARPQDLKNGPGLPQIGVTP